MPRKTSKSQFTRIARKAAIDILQAANYYEDSKDNHALRNMVNVIGALEKQYNIILKNNLKS